MNDPFETMNEIESIPGVWVFESMSFPENTGILVTGISPYPVPVDACEEDVRLKLEILYPDRSFKDPVRLSKENLEARAAFIKGLIRDLVTERSKTAFVSKMEAVYSFLTEACASAEGYFLQQVVMDGGLAWFENGSLRCTNKKSSLVNKSFSDAMIRMSGFPVWRSMHKNVLASGSQKEKELHRTLMSNPWDAAPLRLDRRGRPPGVGQDRPRNPLGFQIRKKR